MAKDISREWLKINKLCKEVKWLTYDPDYSDIDLDLVVKILDQLKEKLRKQLENEGR